MNKWNVFVIVPFGLVLAACAGKTGKSNVTDVVAADGGGESGCGCSICQAACVSVEWLRQEECPVPAPWHYQWCEQAQCGVVDGECGLVGPEPVVNKDVVRQTDVVEDTADLEPEQSRGLGEPCEEDAECFAGFGVCLELLPGLKVCTADCTMFGDCPEGWTCRMLQRGGEFQTICVPEEPPSLCMPCTESHDCIFTACLDSDALGQVCTSQCVKNWDCPVGYECKEGTTVEGQADSYCVPEAGATCTCSPEASQAQVEGGCTVENEFGSCPGTRKCLPEGTISECEGQVPAAEACNGLDDDCDGEVDEWCDCIPDCEGKECGDDGCGGNCGECAPPDGCVGGVCECVPTCCGKECGSDGCGGSCGGCPAGLECTAQGTCGETGQKSLGAPCFLDEECASGLCLAPGYGNVCSQWCDETCPEGWTCAPFSKTGGDESACFPNCIPDCKGKQCGPNGCGSICGACGLGGMCNENGNCLCGTSLPEVQPTCVRAPYSVPPATKFPIAVFAVFNQCIEYNRYYSEWTYGGSEVKIELWGEENHFQDCPACLYSYLGVIWVNGLPPGIYTVQVGEFAAQQVHVLNGDPPAPECQEECPPPLGQGWTATNFSQDAPLELSCGWNQGIDAGLEFDGACHDYTIKNDSILIPLLPVPEVEVLHCTDSDLFVGWDGDFVLGMTKCNGAPAQLDELLVGLAYADDGGSAYVLLVEKE